MVSRDLNQVVKRNDRLFRCIQKLLYFLHCSTLSCKIEWMRFFFSFSLYTHFLTRAASFLFIIYFRCDHFSTTTTNSTYSTAFCVRHISSSISYFCCIVVVIFLLFSTYSFAVSTKKTHSNRKKSFYTVKYVLKWYKDHSHYLVRIDKWDEYFSMKS
jgi:hypothetical protein